MKWIKKSDIAGSKEEIIPPTNLMLRDYLLLGADEKYLYILDPKSIMRIIFFKTLDEDDEEEKIDIEEEIPYQMKCLAKFKFNQDIYYNYYMNILHGRYFYFFFLINI